MADSLVNGKERMVVTRIFDAPRALVWKAWTEAKYAMQWWGPKGFTAPVCKIDFRVGGKYLFCMRSPDGWEGWNGGEYYEIVPQEKIVYSMYFADKDGNKVDPAQYGIENEGGDGEASHEMAHGIAHHDVHAAADEHAARFQVHRPDGEAEEHYAENEPWRAFADGMFRDASGVECGGSQIAEDDGGSAPETDERESDCRGDYDQAIGNDYDRQDHDHDSSVVNLLSCGPTRVSTRLRS